MPNKPTVRNASVVATEPMSLAVLEYENFKTVMHLYSDFRKELKRAAWNRQANMISRLWEIPSIDESIESSSMSDSSNSESDSKVIPPSPISS